MFRLIHVTHYSVYMQVSVKLKHCCLNHYLLQCVSEVASVGAIIGLCRSGLSISNIGHIIHAILPVQKHLVKLRHG